MKNLEEHELNECRRKNSLAMSGEPSSHIYSAMQYIAEHVPGKPETLHEFVWRLCLKSVRPARYRDLPDIVISSKQNLTDVVKTIIFEDHIERACDPSSGFSVLCPKILILATSFDCCRPDGSIDSSKVCSLL